MIVKLRPHRKIEAWLPGGPALRFEGLAAAARKLRQEGVIDTKLAKRMIALDGAVAYLRHATVPLAASLGHELDAALVHMPQRQHQHDEGSLGHMQDAVCIQINALDERLNAITRQAAARLPDAVPVLPGLNPDAAEFLRMGGPATTSPPSSCLTTRQRSGLRLSRA